MQLHVDRNDLCSEISGAFRPQIVHRRASPRFLQTEVRHDRRIPLCRRPGHPEPRRAGRLLGTKPAPGIRRSGGRVEALLSAHAADNPLDRPPDDLAATGDHDATDAGPPAAEVGDRIGPYRLMEQIGEGGFGLVFVAEQPSPVRRKVALKVLKPGMDTRDVVARFEAERQALALMDHPNIARVLDAGARPPGARTS